MRLFTARTVPLLWVLLACRAFAVEASAAAPLRAAFFGSSTTFGTGSSRPEHRWTTLLSRSKGWQELNFGLPGSTLVRPRRPGAVAPALDRLGALLAARPDVVFFMYGANDVAKHEPLAEFAAALGTALSGLSSMRVIVLSPQPNQLTRAVRAPYDEVLRNAAASRHLTYIDSLQAFPPEELVSLSADGLHLNDLGHARLASYLAAELSTLELTAAPPAPASPDAPTPSHPGR